jgi:hypothetical protein
VTRALVIIALVGRAAAAEPTREPPPTSFVIGMDAVGVAVLAGGYAVLRWSDYRNCDVCAGDFGVLMMAIGGISYLALGPVHHHERGRDRRAWWSGALRLGLPVAAGLSIYGATRRDDPAVAAVGLGVLGAVILDWTVLARGARHRPIVFGAPVSHGGALGIAGTW